MDKPKYIPDIVWWQDGSDVWEGQFGQRTKWIGRFDLVVVLEAIRDGRIKL